VGDFSVVGQGAAKNAGPRSKLRCGADSGFLSLENAALVRASGSQLHRRTGQERALACTLGQVAENGPSASTKGAEKKVRLFTQFKYKAQSWDRKRRVIAKAEHSLKGANPRYVLTNLEGHAQALYDEIYCARGEMENRIKEQQLGLFSDRTSCHAWWANQFRLLLSSLAYVLLETLRRLGLSGTELARAQVGTIRLRPTENRRGHHPKHPARSIVVEFQLPTANSSFAPAWFTSTGELQSGADPGTRKKQWWLRRGVFRCRSCGII